MTGSMTASTPPALVHGRVGKAAFRVQDITKRFPWALPYARRAGTLAQY